MSKFINKETMEYVKAKENNTVPQQLQNIRERLNLENEQYSARCTKLERDSVNQNELIAHLGTHMLEMQRIVDSKYQQLVDTIDADLTTQILHKNKLIKRISIVAGVIAVWLITLSILTLRHG